MSRNAEEAFWGFPNTLHLFRFNWLNPLANDLRARKAFAAIVHQAFRGWTIENILTADQQIIPEGHKGRLSQTPAATVTDFSALSGKKLTLAVNPQLKELPDFANRLEAEAARHNITINFLYESTAKPATTPDSFASLYIFKGNQKDALGNWSFLFSTGGPFEPFEKTYTELFSGVATESDEDRRTTLLETLHKNVLDEALGVPVFFENAAIFSSGRYDLSRLNRYDLRPRFFRMLEK